MPLRWAASRRIEFDNDGERAAGAIAYFWLAGTTTPFTVYSDAALTTPHDQDDAGALAGTSKADANGRWPEVWIPFSTTAYRERVVTAGGTQLWDTDSITRTDPVEEAASTVDDTQLLQTGDWVFSTVNETRTGFVRANGRTIGSATSGATERANADTEDLFTFLWNKLGNSQAAVGGGRGASAAADWAANKAIALPDMRGGHPMGLDDMGNTAGSFFSSVPFTNGAATTTGSLAGLNTHTLLTAQMPVTTPAGSITMAGSITFPSASRSVSFTPTGTVLVDGGASHDHSGGVTSVVTSNIGGGGVSTVVTSVVTGNTGNKALNATFTGNAGSGTFNQNTLTANWVQGATTFAGTSFGSGTAHNNVARAILGTYYIKL